MPSLKGYVDHAGSEGAAHWQMLDRIRRFAGGFGTAETPSFAGAGNGSLDALDTHPATVSETWTITCTDATTAGAETWSVSGSVSGAQDDATTGQAYDNGFIAFVLRAGSTAFASNDAWTIDVAQGALSAAGQAWDILRYDTASPKRELIMKGPGLSGSDEIFIGLRTYDDASSDYYNLSVAGFTGYVAGGAFESQPGYYESGIPASQQRIDYWLAVNGQRIVFAIKVGTPVYEHGYAGFLLPYASPGQYPYPLFVGGMLNGLATTRYSDTGHSAYWKGARVNARLRFVDGSWMQPDLYPYVQHSLGAAIRDTEGEYHLAPVQASDERPNNYGVLDGVFHITGFGNAVENTTTVNGTEYVVLQDVARTGFGDYCALEMD